MLAIDHGFIPPELTVAPGDMISWIWVEGGHTVTSGDHETCMPNFQHFNAPLSRMFPLFEYTVPDDFVGKIPYICLPHCADFDMVGLIIVEESGNPADIAPPGGDGVVGPADLAELLSQWGPCPPEGDCTGDIDPQPDGDGLVGPADLAQMLAGWG